MVQTLTALRFAAEDIIFNLEDIAALALVLKRVVLMSAPTSRKSAQII